MSPRFIAAVENFRRLTESLNQQQPGLRKWVQRAASDDAETAGDAIRRIEKGHDAALAGVLWGLFWIREGDLPQARRELQRFETNSNTPTLWSGIALMMLGELVLEMGDAKKGNSLIRRARRLLDPPS